MYDNLKERLTDMSVLARTRTPENALKYIEELEAALDKMKREARNEALREAADIAERWGDPDIQTEILALMEDKTDE